MVEAQRSPPEGIAGPLLLERSRLRDVVTRRTRYELRKAKEREHILLGYKIALDHIDEIIAVIKASANREIASTLYMSTRSVEAHLTKIYRELDVRSRAQLVAKLSANSPQLLEQQERPNRESAGPEEPDERTELPDVRTTSARLKEPVRDRDPGRA